MAGNGDKPRDEHLAGIRLILEEIRDIKKEISAHTKLAAEYLGDAAGDRKRWAEDRKQAAEDRKEAAEDRKEAAEDRKQWAEDRKEAAEDRKQAAEDRREFNQSVKGMRDALGVIGNAGRRIIGTQNRHTELLEEMLRAIKALGRNGKQGNGH